MNEAVFLISLIWGFASLVWIIIQANIISVHRGEFVRYKLYHQKVIGLYIEAARHTRVVVAENKKLKHSITDHIFYPGGYSLEDCAGWYSKYDIKPTIAEQERPASLAEVKHYTESDKHATTYYNAELS